MRLECPNCDATYEVPDSVIPPEGRDVQCSNCGKAWFFDPNPQPTPEPLPETLDRFDKALASEPEPGAAADGNQAADQAVGDADTVAADGAYNYDETYEDDRPGDVPPMVTERPRRPLEASVTDVLREEAEFEAQARAEEGGLEYQDDLPLDAPQTFDVEEDEEGLTGATAASRRDLLPDIDEINSTLRSSSERGEEATPAEAAAISAKAHRSGFRIGFIAVLVILLIAAGLYSYADPIGEAVPALAGVLDAYSGVIGSLRLQLQNAVAGLAAIIS
ncbi:MAG: zinc-ribbon domain-containing protein [Pseudomonadota bacterium]